MLRLRLRAIIEVSFVKSEETNFDALWFSKEWGALIRSLDRGDVICLASKMKNQLVFVHGYTRVVTSGERPWMVLFSQRMRIKRGSGISDEFETQMLGSYARDCGIELIGLKLFEEHLKRLAA
jgi:hypothetical protein